MSLRIFIAVTSSALIASANTACAQSQTPFEGPKATTLASPRVTVPLIHEGDFYFANVTVNGKPFKLTLHRLTGPLDCVYFSGMGPRPKQPVVICPRCRRRMATKEYKPMEPKARKAIKFTDSLVEVVYICESCGTEIKRTIREK